MTVDLSKFEGLINLDKRKNQTRTAGKGLNQLFNINNGTNNKHYYLAILMVFDKLPLNWADQTFSRLYTELYHLSKKALKYQPV